MKTYGTIAFSKGQWVIEPEPHVEIILKRMMPCIKKRQHGRLTVSDTPENARDLEWATKRYPFKAKDLATINHLKEQAAKHRETESVVDRLLAGKNKGRDFELAFPLREYQRVEAELCLTRGSLLNANVVGLGKSAVGIAIVSRAHCRPALVVTMTHLCRQWAFEFKKFAPSLRTCIVKKGTPYDLSKPPRAIPGDASTLVPQTPDVIIINYHKLAGWSATLGRLCKSVIWDEVAELRRSSSEKYAAASHIADKMIVRYAASATPIYNYGDEIWNVMRVIAPGALGTRTEFLEAWCSHENSRGQASIEDPVAFGSYMRSAGLMIRRTRADVGRELPALTNIVQTVESNHEEFDKIQSPAAELARRILSSNPSAKGDAFRAGGELDNLVRQATGLAKAPYVAQFVRMIVENDEQVLLFGWHHAVYAVWMELLADFNPVLYTGEQSATQKEEAKRRFISGESKVLIMSLRSGLGLNDLQNVCATAIFGELDWSPAVHEQDVGRILRDGQDKPVFAYYCVSNDGCDPIMLDVLGVKKVQADGLKNIQGEAEVLKDTGGAHIKRVAELYLKKMERSAAE